MISENIKRLREKFQYSQYDLGRLLGVSKQAVSMYERGEREPNIAIILKLCEVFNTSPNVLFGFADQPREDGKDTELLRSLNELPDNEKELIIDLIESRIKKAGL